MRRGPSRPPRRPGAPSPVPLRELEPYAVAATLLLGVYSLLGAWHGSVPTLWALDWLVFLLTRSPGPDRPTRGLTVAPGGGRGVRRVREVLRWGGSAACGGIGLLLWVLPGAWPVGVRELLLAVVGAGLAYLLLPPARHARAGPLGWGA